MCQPIFLKSKELEFEFELYTCMYMLPIIHTRIYFELELFELEPIIPTRI